MWIVIILQQIPLPMEQRSDLGKTALQVPIMLFRGTVSNRPTYTANGLNGKGILSYTAAQSSDITSDSTIRSIFAVLRQSSGQSAETQPFGGNISATTSGGKFGLKRTGSSMMDSGKSSHLFL